MTAAIGFATAAALVEVWNDQDCLSMWAQQCTCEAIVTADVDGDGFRMTFQHEKGCRAVLRANAARN